MKTKRSFWPPRFYANVRGRFLPTFFFFASFRNDILFVEAVVCARSRAPSRSFKANITLNDSNYEYLWPVCAYVGRQRGAVLDIWTLPTDSHSTCIAYDARG